MGPVPDVIERARSGDRSAFADLYDTHVDAVYRYILYRVREPSDAEDLTSDTILFDDRLRTHLTLAPGALFRQIHESDDIVFTHTVEPVGEWGIEVDGRIVATGGLLYHYNPPYGDIFMEVAEPFRRRGFASYLIQELKRICYERGNVPGARTGQDNIGSRASLQRAGMMACARIVRGRIKR